MSLTALAIRHIAFEDLGFFEPVLRRAGYKVQVVEARGQELASIDPVQPDLLMVLGGPMGVHEADRLPFLAREINFIGRRIAADRPTLGICLGAQLIAGAMGARVYPGAGKEIGFAPIELTPAGLQSPLGVVASGQPVLHWHGDTFDLPRGATLLASTEAYANQAFSVGPNILGLQFHLEAGAGIDRWLVGHAEELRQAGTDTQALAHDAEAQAEKLAAVFAQVLTMWLDGTTT